ncbi:MAG: response regulator transcription factor [Haliea sp.]|nr:response regulator transcription factor [Haliea sp.]
MMLTACDEVEQKIAGLDAGADDYLIKPFDMNELFARVRSILRRSGEKNPLLCAGLLEMNTTTRSIFFAGESVDDLTAKELSILEMLMRNKGRFIAKERLAEAMYSLDHYVQSNTVEVYVSRLRRRFGKEIIESFRGLGYRINSLNLHSIPRRLIAYLVGLGAILWIVAVMATTYYFRNLTLEQADSYLEQYSALSQYSFRLIRLQNPAARMKTSNVYVRKRNH